MNTPNRTDRYSAPSIALIAFQRYAEPGIQLAQEPTNASVHTSVSSNPPPGGRPPYGPTHEGGPCGVGFTLGADGLCTYDRQGEACYDANTGISGVSNIIGACVPANCPPGYFSDPYGTCIPSAPSVVNGDSSYDKIISLLSSTGNPDLQGLLQSFASGVKPTDMVNSLSKSVLQGLCGAAFPILPTILATGPLGASFASFLVMICTLGNILPPDLPPDCNPGFSKKPDGSCVFDQNGLPCKDPTGKDGVYNAQGGCVVNVSSSGPPACPAGQTWDGSKCGISDGGKKKEDEGISGWAIAALVAGVGAAGFAGYKYYEKNKGSWAASGGKTSSDSSSNSSDNKLLKAFKDAKAAAVQASKAEDDGTNAYDMAVVQVNDPALEALAKKAGLSTETTSRPAGFMIFPPEMGYLEHNQAKAIADVLRENGIEAILEVSS